ncbi:MAG: FAD-dependent oxidoreductase [Polyangiaceae bacterium]
MAARLVVVGGGIAGLVGAAILARSGADVTLLERAERLGGKVRQAMLGGRAVDAGPTVLTMPWTLDAAFEEAGGSFRGDLRMRELATLGRHVWPGGATLDLFADVERSVDAVGTFAGAREARAYRAFCAQGRRIFEAVHEPVLEGQRPELASLVSEARRLGLSGLRALGAHRTLWSALGDSFRDPRLVQLFARYATYCGSSALLAPATLQVIAHVEQRGVWSLDGGMYALVEALALLAARAGVRLRTSAHVAEVLVRGGRVAGVRLADGEVLPAATVLHAGDVAALSSGARGTAARAAVSAPAERSLSARTVAMVARARGAELLRHGVLLRRLRGGDAQPLRARRRVPGSDDLRLRAGPWRRRRPAGRAGGRRQASRVGEERFLIICNAPADGDRRAPVPDEVERWRGMTLETLATRDLVLSASSSEVTTQADFARRFPATGGALYGAATHGALSMLRRPGSRSRLPGLYLAGGSVHPGAGVPMAAQSGRLAAQAICADLGSTARSSRVAMPGGTSTA